MQKVFETIGLPRQHDWYKTDSESEVEYAMKQEINQNERTETVFESMYSEESEESVVLCKCNGQNDEETQCIECDHCKIWFHSKCVSLTNTNWNFLVENKDFLWFCQSCIKDNDVISSIDLKEWA